MKIVFHFLVVVPFMVLCLCVKANASCDSDLTQGPVSHTKSQLKLNGISKVVSAMPGTGKSTLIAMLIKAGLKVSDSDSQRFSFLTNENGQYIDKSGNIVTRKEDRISNSNFVSDYVEHIRQAIADNDLVFVSAHEQVRDALATVGIEFDLVRYETDLKDEVVERIRARRSSQPNEIIANVVAVQWDYWMKTIDKPGPKHVFILKSGRFLNDIFRFDSTSKSFNLDPKLLEASKRS